jgi:prepilin-type processing-associated H-X9-DG protein
LAPEPACLTPYVGVAGVGTDAPSLPAGHRNAGVFGYDRRTALADVKDGTSNTLLILESARDNGPWARGGPATLRGLDRTDSPYLGTGRPFGGTHFAENILFWRGRSTGCNAAMADGSVRFLQEAIAPRVLEALATIAGGEKIGDDW